MSDVRCRVSDVVGFDILMVVLIQGFGKLSHPDAGLGYRLGLRYAQPPKIPDPVEGKSNSLIA